LVSKAARHESQRSGSGTGWRNDARPTGSARSATERITGLPLADPLYADVLAVLERRSGG
jgi:hypothetical protein